MNPKPLRGRVVLRYVPDVRQEGLILMPDQSPDLLRSFQKSLGRRGKHCHRGIVLAHGDPARNKWGHEVPIEFNVGDEVLFVYHHADQFSEGQEWDGEPALWVSQEEVQGVIER